MHSQKLEAYSFLILESKETDQTLLLSFSDQIMRWSEDIWIIDVRRFLNYWVRVAEYKKQSILSCWREVFRHQLLEEVHSQSEKVVDFSPPYRAVSAKHPWKGLLIIRQMQEGNHFGLVSDNSKFAKTAITRMNWNAWWSEVKLLGKHWDQSRLKGYRNSVFNQQCKNMSSVYKYLFFKSLGETKRLNEKAIIRRFGKYLNIVWKWTFDQTDDQHHLLESFPWKPFDFFQAIERKSDLEYAIFFWEQAELFLREDLNRLAHHFDDESQRVFEIEWKVFLEDGEILILPIQFKHPHSLKKEAPDHKTALLQAQFKFEEIEKRYSEKTGLDPEDVHRLGIIQWKLKVKDMIRLPKVWFDIFGDSQVLEEEEERKQLENELPVDLISFHPYLSWVPENSLTPESQQFPADLRDQKENLISCFLFHAKKRPIYIYDSPRKLNWSRTPRNLNFLESVSSPWWVSKNSSNYERTYYEFVDSSGKAYWVFKNPRGEWFCHGVYG